MSHDNPENTHVDSQQVKIIEKQLEQINPQIFKGLDPRKRKELIQTVSLAIIERKITHSGPLPHPDTLAKYAEIIPNGAERIMQGFEKQQTHRMGIETLAVTEQLKQSGNGQKFGLAIGIIGILCGFTAIMFGHEWPGAAIFGGSLTGLVSVFVYGKKRQGKSLNEKN